MKTDRLGASDGQANDETHEDTYRHDRENVELRNAGKFQRIPGASFFSHKEGCGGDTDSRNDEQVEQVQSK